MPTFQYLQANGPTNTHPRTLPSTSPGRQSDTASRCCLAYAAGAGHDWTCGSSNVASHIERALANETFGAESIEPLAVPPPAYTAKPRRHEHIFHRELPPTYQQVIRANRCRRLAWVPGFVRLTRPASRPLSDVELAEIGIYGVPRPLPVQRDPRNPMAFFKNWQLGFLLGVMLIIIIVVSKCT